MFVVEDGGVVGGGCWFVVEEECEKVDNVFVVVCGIGVVGFLEGIVGSGGEVECGKGECEGDEEEFYLGWFLSSVICRDVVIGMWEEGVWSLGDNIGWGEGVELLWWRR